MSIPPDFRQGFMITAVITITLLSCQKENEGDGTAAGLKPKVGTTWTYSYYTYYSYGGVATTKTVTWKAISEETLGGEKWLKINELGVDTTVYLLREKSDGLYQYINNSANLFCKNPTSPNDTYTSYHRDSVYFFKVSGAGITLPTNIGDIKVNFYEGRKSVNLIDEIWFNANAWIVRHQFYRKAPLATDYYKYSALFIRDITY
ncbi:MAG: hypothetical protein ACT4OJ_09395 [Bacteroidota bacterium]